MTARRWLIAVISILVLAIAWHFIIVQAVSYPTAGQKAKGDFVRENGLIGDFPKQAGFPAMSTSTTCTLLERRHFADIIGCFSGSTSNFSDTANPAAYHPDKLVALLKTSGWSADNPTELSNSKDKLTTWLTTRI